MILNFFFNNSVTVNSQHNFKFFKINTNNKTIFYNPFPSIRILTTFYMRFLAGKT